MSKIETRMNASGNGFTGTKIETAIVSARGKNMTFELFAVESLIGISSVELPEKRYCLAGKFDGDAAYRTMFFPTEQAAREAFTKSIAVK